jgi:hypothetical protein
MTDTVDTIVVTNTRRKYAVRLTNRSDSTGESAVVKVDKSALTGPDGTEPSKLVLEEAEWNVQGFSYVTLLWDHTTDDEMAVLSGSGYKDYRDFGGLVDPGSAGGTGDVLLTTTGATATSSYDIFLVFRKKD